MEGGGKDGAEMACAALNTSSRRRNEDRGKGRNFPHGIPQGRGKARKRKKIVGPKKGKPATNRVEQQPPADPEKFGGGKRKRTGNGEGTLVEKGERETQRKVKCRVGSSEVKNFREPTAHYREGRPKNEGGPGGAGSLRRILKWWGEDGWDAGERSGQ